MLQRGASTTPAHAAEAEPGAITVLAFALVFFAALSIYFAVVEGPGRLHHDMSEAFAWGQEFQLGYHQHPPFWAWICAVWFMVFPHEIWAFGILSAINATISLFGAWLLIGDFSHGRKRLTATALLLLIPSYTYLAFKYNANIILISLWPLTLHAFMRAIESGRARDALAFGLFIGLALMSKYYSLILIATCAIAALAHPRRDGYLRSVAPFISAGAAALICAPHVWWLATHNAPPVRYLQHMSGLSWAQMATYIGSTLLGAIKLNALAIIVVAVLSRARPRDWIETTRRRWRDPRFRVLAILALAPLVLTFVAAIVMRTRIYAEMIFGIFPLTTLLAMEAMGVADIDKAWRTASKLAAAVIVGGVLASPLISAATIYYSGNAMNVMPSRELAFEATRIWRAETGTPLAYVASFGSYDQAAAFFSPDHPHAFIEFDYDRSPWVKPDDLAKRGFLAMCPKDNVECLHATDQFAGADAKRSELTLAHSALGHTAKPVTFVLTLIPPRS